MAAITTALFDLNGTLLDPAAIGEPWSDPNLGFEVLDAAVRTAMVDALLGHHREFREHIRSGLETVVAARGHDPVRIGRALELAAQLPPYDDAREALATIADAGIRLAVLTNSGAAAGRSALEAAGLAAAFDEILGVDAVQRFKPHPAVYAYAVDALGAVPDEVVLVAAHAWDVWGARHCGLRGAWIGRGPHPYPSVAPPPDAVADDLRGAAARIVELRGV